MKKAHPFVHLSFALCLLNALPALADTLVVAEFQVTTSAANETTPTIGNDGTGDLVVYTARAVLSDGTQGPGHIFYQRIADGAPSGPAVQVTNGLTDDQLNDVSGDWIVYTAYDSIDSSDGNVMLYRISTRQLLSLARAPLAQEPRINGNNVVWVQGAPNATQVMRYQLDWLGTAEDPRVVAGPVPAAEQVAIGDRFIVWAQGPVGQRDIWAVGVGIWMRFQVTTTPDVDETQPATSGDWTVWRAITRGATEPAIIAKNWATGEDRVIPATGESRLPSIDGDLIAWESRVTDNYDVFVYRISRGDSFPVTTDPSDQYLNDVFGSMVAYVDTRGANEDIYVSGLSFQTEDPCASQGGDADGDGVCDAIDNCPAVANADQADQDGDGIGDACEDPCAAQGGDTDGDGVCNAADFCPYENATGLDANSDGCIDSIGGLTQLIQTLVTEGVIDAQLQTSLLSKIANAGKSAAKEDICAAIGQLEAFKNEVNAQRGKKISDGAASLVMTYANNVIAEVLSTLPPGETC